MSKELFCWFINFCQYNRERQYFIISCVIYYLFIIDIKKLIISIILIININTYIIYYFYMYIVNFNNIYIYIWRIIFQIKYYSTFCSFWVAHKVSL